MFFEIFLSENVVFSTDPGRGVGVLGEKFGKTGYFAGFSGCFGWFFGDFGGFLDGFLGPGRVGITGVTEKNVEKEFGEITVFGDVRSWIPPVRLRFSL